MKEDEELHARLNRVLENGLGALKPKPQPNKDKKPVVVKRDQKRDAEYLSETQITLMNVYWVMAWIVGVLVFIGAWIYCIVHYGFLLGVGLGWLPSAIVAVVAGMLWPLVVITLVVLVYMLLRGMGYF